MQVNTKCGLENPFLPLIEQEPGRVPVWCVGVPDGSVAIVDTNKERKDHTMKIYSSSGILLRSWTASHLQVSSVAFSPTGSMVYVSVPGDRTIRCFQLDGTFIRAWKYGVRKGNDPNKGINA